MRKNKIFIVEDERIIAEDIKRTLLNFGYEVPAIVSSGETAIEQANELNPDLVLMDIMLEGKMNGIQAASRIRENLNIPVIYLTAYANEYTLQSAKTTEPFGYIIKPFEERELHATIEMAFYRHKIEIALHKKSHQQELLLESAKHLTSSLDVKKVLAQIGKGAREILHSHTCAIYLLEQNNKVLHPVVVIDPEYEKETLSTKLDIDQSFTGLAVKAKKGMIFNFSEEQKSGTHIPGTPIQKDEHIIVAPFIIDDEVIGAVCLSKIGTEFTEEDLTLTEAFATYASTALKNAQTHRQLQIEMEERQIAEKKLRETQARLALIFKNVPNIILYEKYGGKEFVSENIYDLLGYKAEEFLNRKIQISNIIHPEDKNIISRKFKNWFASEKYDFLTLWYRLQKADKSYVWIEDRIILIKPETGKKYIVGIMIDNSDIKHAEEALKESQLLYKGVVEDQSELIIRYRSDGTLTFINGAYCRYYDRAYSDIIGSNWFNTFLENDKKKICGKIINLTKKNPTLTFEYKESFSEDETRWIEWTIRAIFDEEDHIIEYQSVGRNITDSKLAEKEKENIMKQLIQSQKMEVVGRLAGGIAHDFNNLLTAINGYANIALTKLSPDNPIKKDIEVIQSCGEKAADLTSQLLAFSRKQIVEPAVMNLNSVILEMDKMLKRLIGEDIEFITSPGKNLNSVKVDKGQIEQILTNLVVNARDALTDSGKIIVKTSNAHLGKEISSIHNKIAPGNYVMLSIKDNGIGMNEEVQKHIFEPFFTTKDHGKGTGLGLATVFGIIQQNNGYIFIDSEEGKGTDFTIYFQVCDEIAVEVSASIDKDNLPKGNETILLTEDEPSIRDFVYDILEEYGYTILEASNGEEALKITKQYNKPIHLLFTDMVMPNMNGHQLAQAIRKLHPKIKVLFMSGYTESPAIQRGILEETTAFLQKPFSSSDLILKVRKVLDSEQNN